MHAMLTVQMWGPDWDPQRSWKAWTSMITVYSFSPWEAQVPRLAYLVSFQFTERHYPKNKNGKLSRRTCDLNFGATCAPQHINTQTKNRFFFFFCRKERKEGDCYIRKCQDQRWEKNTERGGLSKDYGIPHLCCRFKRLCFAYLGTEACIRTVPFCTSLCEN